MIKMNDELKSGRKGPWLNFKTLSQLSPGGTEETMKHLSE
jgi:hypothetical protein